MTAWAPHQEIQLSPGNHPYIISQELPSLCLDTSFYDLVMFAATRNLRTSVNLLRRKCVECTNTFQRSLMGSPVTNHKKWRTDWSDGNTPTSRNILSMSADTANWCWRNLISVWINFCRRSGPVSRNLFMETPKKLEAPLRTLRRTLPGLFAIMAGWCGKYHSLPSLCSVSSRFCTLTTYFLLKSSRIVCA